MNPFIREILLQNILSPDSDILLIGGPQGGVNNVCLLKSIYFLDNKHYYFKYLKNFRVAKVRFLKIQYYHA